MSVAIAEMEKACDRDVMYLNRMVPIDSVYALLRENPENVRSGIHLSRYEAYLEEKLTKQQEHHESEAEALRGEVAELKEQLKCANDGKIMKRRRKRGTS